MKKRVFIMILAFLTATIMLTPLFAEAQRASETTYTYTSFSEYWMDSYGKVWLTKGEIRQWRGLHFIGIPPQTDPPTPPNGGINIIIRDVDGELVYNITGGIEMVGTKRIVNRKSGLRVGSGIVKIEVVTVNDAPEVGSIEGVYIGKGGIREVYTHGTGFFAGVKIKASGTGSSAPTAYGRLLNRTMAGTITFPS